MIVPGEAPPYGLTAAVVVVVTGRPLRKLIAAFSCRSSFFTGSFFASTAFASTLASALVSALGSALAEIFTGAGAITGAADADVPAAGPWMMRSGGIMMGFEGTGSLPTGADLSDSPER